jgi:uncharacterized protein DUF397
MTTPELAGAVWRKSSRSGDHGGACVEVASLWRKSSRSADHGGNCVEVATLLQPERAIGLRDSKDPTGPVLSFTPTEWNVFIARIKAS